MSGYNQQLYTDGVPRQKRKMPGWLMAVIFLACAGAGLGITMILALLL